MLPYIKLEKRARSILCEHFHGVTMVIARAYRLTGALFLTQINGISMIII